MMEKTLILKHISRMLCLLISYSKFTRTEIQNSWKMLMDIVFFIIEKTFYTCLQDDAGIGRIG